MAEPFSSELSRHLRQAGLPMRRVAARADIPAQTLFNWLSGTQPRRHPQLGRDIRRLAAALELDEIATNRLLELAGCAPRNPATNEQEANIGREIPKDWFPAGSHPGDYDMGVKKLGPEAAPVAFLKSRRTTAGFGTLMQIFLADDFRGKRLRLSAKLKAEAVEDGAGLWMRCDGAHGEMLAFDNMQDRSVSGTTDWTDQEVVLDVADSVRQVAFGILLSGPGEVQASDLSVTVVGPDVRTTATRPFPSHPSNLSFEE